MNHIARNEVQPHGGMESLLEQYTNEITELRSKLASATSDHSNAAAAPAVTHVTHAGLSAEEQARRGMMT